MKAERNEGAPRRVGVGRVHAQMFLSRALVATSFPIGAAITHGLDPAMLTLLRFALATLLFAPFVAFRHGITLPTPRAFAGYAAISACLVTFFWGMFEALRLTSALNAATLFTLVPGIAAMYAAFIVRERLGTHRLIALGIGLVGAIWVVFRGDPDRLLALAFNQGDLIFLGGCFALGLYMPLVRRVNRGEPAAIMTFWVLLLGTGWLVLLNNSAIWRTDWGAVDVSVFAGIAYLAVFTTIITFFIQQHATLHIGPTRVTSYSYLNPAFVVLIEWAAGHGLPPLMTLPGVLIILAATLVVQSGAGDDRDSRPTFT
jgi:drug/metabolite transporter (DMT)-like permease